MLCVVFVDPLARAAPTPMMRDAFAQLKTKRSSNTVKTPLYPFEEFSALMAFDEVTAFDERYGKIA